MTGTTVRHALLDRQIACKSHAYEFGVDPGGHPESALAVLARAGHNESASGDLDGQPDSQFSNNTESFRDQAHLDAIVTEAQAIVDNALAP